MIHYLVTVFLLNLLEILRTAGDGCPKCKFSLIDMNRINRKLESVYECRIFSFIAY